MVAEAGVARVEAVARLLAPASPQLLADRVLQSRQDWKFLLPLDVLPELLERLADDHAVLWAGSAVLARYETLYFDTADRRCFHDHRRGRPRRFKVRARTYADRRVTMLEVKRKLCSGTVKERMPRSFQDHRLDWEGSRFVATHSPLHPEQLRPVLANQFRRLTLLGVHDAQRVTFDLALSFSEGDRRRAIHGVVVAEVKSASGRARTPALQAFAACGLRPTRMSKYCVGTALVNPEIRANRFLPVLRTLSRLEAS
ncbi:MAG: polyphosphate polymerase domain-containing protein [Deltaproteobacteria bacterium]|nr:MAG: polyphosphate polymerase domain-containing protein [Deltaproteobacteria bacterium]